MCDASLVFIPVRQINMKCFVTLLCTKIAVYLKIFKNLYKLVIQLVYEPLVFTDVICIYK